MANISVITLPDGSSKNIKDATARSQIQTVADQSVMYNHAIDSNFSGTIYKVAKLYTLKANTAYVICFGSLTSTDTDSSVCSVNLYNNGVSVMALGGASRGNNVVINVTPTGDANELYVYASNSYQAGVGDTVTVSNLLVIEKSLYDAGFTDYQPYALPNTALTTATTETYDRVCSKNVLEVDKIFTSQSNGVTYTLNSDGSITAKGTATTLSYVTLGLNNAEIYAEKWCNGNYVLSGCPSGGNFETGYSMYAAKSAYTMIDTGSGVVLANTNETQIRLVIRISSGVTIDKTFKPMVCSKADWDISHDYVPYNTLDSTTLPIAVKELSDADGQKNLAPVNSASSAATGYFGRTNVSIPAGTYIISYKLTTTGQFGLGITVDGTAIAKNSTSPPYSNTLITHEITANTGITFYQFYSNGAATVADFMICTKAQWDISHEYQPYALSNVELTAKEKQNESDILTVAEYGGGINKLNPVPIFTSGQYAVYDATTNTYSETAGHLDTFPNIRFMIQACTGTTASDFAVVSTLVNSNITQNGTPAWLFTKLSTFNRLYVGHNGSQTDCKFFFDVSNLEDNQKYYLCVNITNYTHANNEPFTWKNVMVLSEEEYLNGWWHEYQPYALSNVKLTPALIECVDSGKKNLINSTSGSGTRWVNIIFSEAIPTGNYVVGFSTITSADNTSGTVQVNLMSGETNVGSPSYNAITLSKSPLAVAITATSSFDRIRLYADSDSTTSINKVVSYTTAFLCEKSLWDVSQKIVPYALDNVELTVKEQANENNISLKQDKPTASAERYNTTDTYAYYVTLTIPANRVCKVSAALSFSNSQPRGIAISQSNDSATFDTNANLIGQKVETSEAVPQLIAEGYCAFSTEKTLYVWAKSASAASNSVFASVEYLT